VNLGATSFKILSKASLHSLLIFNSFILFPLHFFAINKFDFTLSLLNINVVLSFMLLLHMPDIFEAYKQQKMKKNIVIVTSALVFALMVNFVLIGTNV